MGGIVLQGERALSERVVGQLPRVKGTFPEIGSGTPVSCGVRERRAGGALVPEPSVGQIQGVEGL